MDKKYGQAWYVPGVNSIVTHYLIKEEGKQ